MKPFQSPDLLKSDLLLTTEEIQMRDTVRDFVSKEVLPIIGEYFEKGEFPKQLIQPLAEMGTLGSTIQGYGCAGLHPTAYGLMMQEIERGDSGLRSFVSVQGALCMYPIATYGSEELKKKYLPEMAQGKLIGCFGLTEPDFGSNPGGMRTTCVETNDGFVLNGNKMWITNGTMADLAIIWAKDHKTAKVHGFVVEKSDPGFKAQNIERKFSLRASVTSELILTDCRIPKSRRLDVVGLRGPFSCLNQARFGIAWGAVGASMACYDEAVQYALTRVQFNKPIASHQLVQAKLVDMLKDITHAQLLNIQLGRLKDKGLEEPAMISLAKMTNVSNALKHARLTRDILGASGITYEYQCARHMLNLESVNTYEGTEDIHRLILGEKITGIPAYTN